MGVESRLVQRTQGDERSSGLAARGLTSACIDRPARPSRQFARGWPSDKSARVFRGGRETSVSRA